MRHGVRNERDIQQFVRNPEMMEFNTMTDVDEGVEAVAAYNFERLAAGNVEEMQYFRNSVGTKRRRPQRTCRVYRAVGVTAR